MGIYIFLLTLAGFPMLVLVALFAASLDAGIIAQLLEDPPLERYVKNCPFRRLPVKKILNETFENVINLVKDREKNTKFVFEKWKDPRKTTQDLMDIILGYNVEINQE